MKMRFLLPFLILIGLSGCATVAPSTPSNLWVVSTTKDEFSDVVTQMVTVGSFYSGGATYTQTGKLYPFVGIKNGETYVGIRSGGTYRIPTGTVQIRIDDNAAWTITPDDTPTDLVPGAATSPAVNKDISADMMANMAKIMSPYTAATGDKADKIIKQMLAGKVIKYRTIGLNQAASSTGEVKLDASFTESIRSIGIPVGKP
ncbi:MAG: hypothetical protein LBI48_08025 [Burkholderiaceae bacterium]|jgi:hypothetical protein|nr:hypothetical protein [Burkholderiaceae bacterium]